MFMNRNRIYKQNKSASFISRKTVSFMNKSINCKAYAIRIGFRIKTRNRI